ncbi:MAG: MFS transporter [Elusimicrobiota bacterium]
MPAPLPMKRPGPLWILFFAQAVMVAGIALSFPFFALYLSRERGIPMGTVGLLLSLCVLLMAVSQALGGELSDRIGRSKVMSLSIWLRTACIFAQAFAILRAWPVPAVVATHMVGGFFGGFFGPAAQAWVADHVPPDQRLRSYGFLRVAINLGWALGPALGGVLATRSYPLAFFVTGLACSVCGVILSGLIRDKRRAERSDSLTWQAALDLVKDRRLAAFCAYAALMGIVMAQMVAPLSVFAVTYAGLSEAQVGLLFSINGLIVVAVQSAVSKRCSRHRLTTSLAAGAGIYALGYGAVGCLHGFLALAAAMAVISFGEVMVSPGIQALGVNLAPKGRTGRYAGVSGFAWALGHAGGPLLGGLGVQYLAPTRPRLPWLLVGLLSCAAGLGFFSLRRKLVRQEEGLQEVPLVQPCV